MLRYLLKISHLSICCGFLALGGTLSCTKWQNGSSASTKAAKVGFVLATISEERYAKDRQYFEEAVTALGGTVEFVSCDNDVSVQTAKVEALVAKGIDVLVIQPVKSEAAGSLVSLAKREGIQVIAYDRIIRNAAVDLYVTQNSFQVGALQAQESAKQIGGKGNVVILMGEEGHSVADEITRGNLSELAKYPQIKVVVKLNHPGWSTDLALETVETTLARYKNDVSAVLANNDGMALAAIQALDAQKLVGRVFVAGADADIAAVKAIVRGRQSMTVLKGIKPLATAAAQAAVTMAKGKTPKSDSTLFNGKKEVLVINTPVEAVVRENLREVIVESGFHTENEVFGSTGE